MKKGIKIIIPVILIGLLLSTTLVRGAYQVTVGQTYDYDIIKANVSITVDSTSVSASGFYLDGHKFPEGTPVTVEVLTVDSFSVTWSVTADGYSEDLASLPLDLLAIVIFLFYPIFIVAFVTSEPLNATEIEEGGLLLYPFLDTDQTTWDFFDQLDDETIISSYSEETGFGDLTVNAKYQEVSGVMIFDWFIDGKIDYSDPTESIDIDVTHNFKCAYEMSSGVMNGIRMKWEVTGSYNGTSFDSTGEYHTEKSGYNLPAFEFGPGGVIPGFEWFIALGALGVLVLVPIIIRKYRK